jgi:hypothetical protein
VIRLIRNYLFWSYERGSFHYDVMVTMILLFLFVGPIFINFKDKPVPKIPMHTSEVLVREAGSSGNSGRFVYEIRREDLGAAATDTDLRNAMLAIIQPIAGNVTIQNYKAIADAKGKVLAYDVTVLR